ncbi:hypothetical protein ACJA3J_11805 [Halobacillus sp. SY10]|uniref:hypothetical protein n=1 Tax=Halobacillus sp. SY10 TaxID=3381356 RepID=UPI0038791496
MRSVHFIYHWKNTLDKNRLKVIVVAIEKNPEERINEYCPWINGVYSEGMLRSM